MAAQSRGKKLIVIGGGIAGLSYVHYLRNFLTVTNKGHLIDKIILLESNKYLGGSIKTQTFDDRLIHEQGPRSVRFAGAKSRNTVTLLEQLGLENQLVVIDGKSSAGVKRYVYNQNKLHLVGASLGSLFSKVPGGKTRIISAAIRDLFRAKKLDLDKFPHGDPTIYQFFSHRFGDEIAELVLDPLLRGITAGDVRKLSCQAMFGDILAREQAHGSVLRGMSKSPVTPMVTDEWLPNEMLKSNLLQKFNKDKISSWNLKTGLQTLPERLSNSLLNTNEDGKVSIYNNTRVESIEIDDYRKKGGDPCRVHVRTIDGDHVKLEADHIVAALPSVQLAGLTKSMDEKPRSVFETLGSIIHVPVGCVTIEWRDMLRKPKAMDSFGFLTHSKSKSRILGTAFDSAMFPSIDDRYRSTRITCMIGGAWMEEMTGVSDVNKIDSALLEQIAIDEFRRILNVHDEPYRMSSYLWKTGIANYHVGHQSLVKKAREDIESMRLPLTLLGQSYDGIAVNDVIWSARMEADSFVKKLE